MQISMHLKEHLRICIVCTLIYLFRFSRMLNMETKKELIRHRQRHLRHHLHPPVIKMTTTEPRQQNHIAKKTAMLTSRLVRHHLHSWKYWKLPKRTRPFPKIVIKRSHPQNLQVTIRHQFPKMVIKRNQSQSVQVMIRPALEYPTLKTRPSTSF